MDSLTSFFEMGGYAPFVWPAYILAAVVLTGLLVLSLRSLRRNEDTLKTLRAQRRGSPLNDEVDL